MKELKDTREIVSIRQMYLADELAIRSGISGIRLMEAAGQAVADHITGSFTPRPVAVLCGPGNNGGDGYVVARHLTQQGWNVSVYALDEHGPKSGDAHHHAKLWWKLTKESDGRLSAFSADGHCLVVDAVFGAGLTRPVDGNLGGVFEQIFRAVCPVVSIDLPSGVNGDTGEVPGAAIRADSTVTFFRRKPAHILHPGTSYCGKIMVADIGISETTIPDLNISIRENDPVIWRDGFPVPSSAGHKFDRGHAVILGGETMTGAARLAARAARRCGAGLSSIAAPRDSFSVYAAGDPGTLVEPIGTIDDFSKMLDDSRRNAVLVGPGAGVSDNTKRFTLSALSRGMPIVVDADSLSAFAGELDIFKNHTHALCVLTPHEGEFARLFGLSGDKMSRACEAASVTGAVVLLKGPDTIIAQADGNVIINTNGPPDLATAGAGDVLAGVIVALLAQGMTPFDAAGAGAWIHGETAKSLGAGLIAEDLCEGLPSILKQLRNPV